MCGVLKGFVSCGLQCVIPPDDELCGAGNVSLRGGIC